MRGFFSGLILGIILGAVGYWFVEKQAREHPAAEQRYEASAANLRQSASETAHNLSDAFKAKMETLDLRTNEISDELSKTGKVIRRNARDIGDRVIDAAGDARIVTDIKARYALDSDLSAWKISVTSDQGHVSLSGTVSTPEGIAKAIAIALEVDGVRDVTSTITVNPKT